MEENNKKFEKGTLGWLREQQKIKAKKDGFDDIESWLKWKISHQSINRNEICNHCKKHKIEIGNSYREIDNDGIPTGKWVCKNCYNYKLVHGKYINIFGTIGWYNELIEKYGKEFTDWAMKNKDRMPRHWLNTGCKTDKEYRNKIAQNAGFESRYDREDYNARTLGFKNRANRYGWDKRKTQEHQEEMEKRRAFRKTKDYRDTKARESGYKDDNERSNTKRWERGSVTKMEDYDECESYIGCVVGEDTIARPLLDTIFEIVDKKKFNNPRFEFSCKNPRQEFLDRYPQFKLEKNKEYKIDVKTAHYINGYWKYRIDYNDIADIFLLIGLQTKNTPIYKWLIRGNEMIVYGRLMTKRKFYDRSGIQISVENLNHFNRYELNEEEHATSYYNDSTP